MSSAKMLSAAGFFIVTLSSAIAQTTATAPSRDQVVEHVAPAVALILVSTGNSQVSGNDFGVIVRPDGRAPQEAPRTGTEQSVGASSASVEFLRSFETYHIKTKTIYMKSEVLLKSCQKSPEFAAWKLKPVENPGSADLTIEITLPFLSWGWNYQMIQRASGRLLASGKVKALEQHQAVPLLVADFVKTIASARGAPEMQGLLAAPLTSETAGLKKWHVSGTALREHTDLTLSIGENAIFLDESSGKHVEISTFSILSAYHFVPENAERRQRIEGWEKGWDKACEATQGKNTCLALLGAPIWLLGNAILRIPEPASHFIAIRWQDDQRIMEVPVQVEARDWKDILDRLQTVMRKSQGDASFEVFLDAEQLRRGFETAKQKSMKIFLDSPVYVGSWHPIGPGEFRIVVLERNDARAEVFFFDLSDTKLERTVAVVAAYLYKDPREVGTVSATLRDKYGSKLLDEIRFGDAVLRFE